MPGAVTSHANPRATSPRQRGRTPVPPARTGRSIALMNRPRGIPWIAALIAVPVVAVALALWFLLPQSHETSGASTTGVGAPGTSVPPALGADATNVGQLRDMLADMGRQSVTWNVSYMSDDDQVNVDLLDETEALGVRHHVVTLEFWSLRDQDQVLQAIAHGAVDNHLRGIAHDMAGWQQQHPQSELIVRPLHEANLMTYPWSFADGNGHDNQQEDFAPAWHQIWQVMRQENPQLKFLLSPNGGDVSSYDWGVPATEVDYVGHDRYNRSEENRSWATPEQVHDGTIQSIQRVYPGKPYVIAETGTSDPGPGSTGHSKAEWFQQLATWMKGPAAQYGVVAVCYFDYDKSGQNGNDWRIYPEGKPGAEAARQAFQVAFADFR
jgi:hypothetical protein